MCSARMQAATWMVPRSFPAVLAPGFGEHKGRPTQARLHEQVCTAARPARCQDLLQYQWPVGLGCRAGQRMLHPAEPP